MFGEKFAYRLAGHEVAIAFPPRGALPPGVLFARREDDYARLRIKFWPVAAGCRCHLHVLGGNHLLDRGDGFLARQPVVDVVGPMLAIVAR